MVITTRHAIFHRNYWVCNRNKLIDSNIVNVLILKHNFTAILFDTVQTFSNAKLVFGIFRTFAIETTFKIFFSNPKNTNVIWGGVRACGHPRRQTDECKPSRAVGMPSWSHPHGALTS